MDLRALVGRNVLNLRKASGLTQEVVAVRAEITQQYLSGLERGKRNPSIETLGRIAMALGVSHVQLVLPAGLTLHPREPSEPEPTAEAP